MRHTFHHEIVSRKGPCSVTSKDADALAWSFSLAGTATAALNYYRALPAPLCVGFDACCRNPIIEPVLQLHGSLDRYLGCEIFAGHDRVCTDYQLKIVEGSSHWLQQDAVEAVLQAVGDFIGTQPGPLNPPPDPCAHRL